MGNPRWLLKARTFQGEQEVRDEAKLEVLFKGAGLKLNPAQTPWCAAFVSGVLEACGVKSTRTAWARDYLQWGVKLTAPLVGCIVVFSRGVSSGHVAFFLGFTKGGDIRVLGGNQHDEVCEAVMPRGRVLGFRWPAGEATATAMPIPPKPRDPPREAVAPPEPKHYEPEAAPISPSMVTSKTGFLSAGIGLGGAAEAVQQINDVATQVAQAKDAAVSLAPSPGVWAVIWAHPGIVMGLVVAVTLMAAGAFIWWDHRRYRRALSESQASP